MGMQSFSSGSSTVASVPITECADASTSPRRRMSTRSRLLFFLTAWLIVLMPFLFWWSTWFGRQLSPQKIEEYLKDDKHPRHIQHALVQIGERLGRHDASASKWNGQLIRLAAHPVEEVRNTDAWVMGQDTSVPGFHDALLKMLQDPSLSVRGNAALSLVRFGDARGRPQIVALLQPARIISPGSGRVVDVDKPGTAVHQGGLVAKIQEGQLTTEVRSPVSGRIGWVRSAAGAVTSAGAEIATVEPSDDQVWEALRGLYIVGQPDDLSSIRAYERESREVPDRVREQAILTTKAIQERSRR
jgi:HEAT repeat